MEFDELVEHLDDLIELVRSERFSYFANALNRVRARVDEYDTLYAVRTDAPQPTPPRPSPASPGEPAA